MTTAVLLSAALPVLHLFTPLTLIEQVQRTPSIIFSVLDLCLAVAYLALWRAAPDYRVFRSMGLFFALVAVIQLWQYNGGDRSAWMVLDVAAVVLIQTAADAMRIPFRRWLWLLWADTFFVLIAGWFASMAFIREWPIVFSQVALAILIFRGFRGGDARDRMIAAAFSVYFFARATLLPSSQRLTGLDDFLRIGGWKWHIPGFALTLLGAATLAIFVRDLTRDRRDKQRMATELAAGRAVQQVLIPEEIPAIPGFNIRSVYKPHGEVGGDFFQILPLPSGSVLVAIGDVSGKGMPAAMMVALLVGALHTLAETTSSPGQLLSGLNRRALGRSRGGFTTCLVLRADTDGTLAVANAGHIAPYCDGRELPLENGLPLGIAADSVYPESTLQLAPDSQLTLVTDGVIEARNKSGELFGFDRAQAMSAGSAESIAHAAQEFGQDDDITALTLTRTRVAEPLASPSRDGSIVEALNPA